MMTDICSSQTKQRQLFDLDEIDSLIYESLVGNRFGNEMPPTERKRKADSFASENFSSTDFETLSSSFDSLSSRDRIESSSIKRRARYLKKKAVLQKIERMLAMPTLTGAAGNAGDIDAVTDIVNTYFTSDCDYILPSQEAFKGRDGLLKYVLVWDETCPDYTRVFRNIRFSDMEVTFDVSCSGTKMAELDRCYDPLQTFSAHLADKADRIVSSGKTYKFLFRGTITMLLTPDLSCFQKFWLQCHSCNIIESRVDLEDEI